MEIGSILAILISVFGFLYAIFRDNSKDTDELIERIQEIETKVAVQESSIERIETELDKVRDTLRNLEVQMHELDLKVERILTILEQKQR
jgi:phage shock protein A